MFSDLVTMSTSLNSRIANRHRCHHLCDYFIFCVLIGSLYCGYYSVLFSIFCQLRVFVVLPIFPFRRTSAKAMRAATPMNLPVHRTTFVTLGLISLVNLGLFFNNLKVIIVLLLIALFTMFFCP
ncbi:unnamed protein product [Angiostrongylus costaricensis]|uniref:PRA1 family protein n=1 Tax=Angiostrongylus costaricensis TaxID=334426 RepID=A0A0R3PHA5_ANGCS|nr:unnamed protein product [Angiostrongylus costaricensis]